MCIVAAAIPAFADVTYEPVALSDINSGDEVVMVGSNGGKLYFATPTIDSSSYLTCLAVTGDVSERVTLTNDQNGQIQKFIITTDGSTLSLKKAMQTIILRLRLQTVASAGVQKHNLLQPILPKREVVYTL